MNLPERTRRRTIRMLSTKHAIHLSSSPSIIKETHQEMHLVSQIASSPSTLRLEVHQEALRAIQYGFILLPYTP